MGSSLKRKVSQNLLFPSGPTVAPEEMKRELEAVICLFPKTEQLLAVSTGETREAGAGEEDEKRLGSSRGITR